MVSVDHLRAYLQIIDVSSILGLDHDVVDHAFQLFRDCSSATCLRNRSIEALATAALVHAIREAQEPRTLQVCSVILFDSSFGWLLSIICSQGIFVSDGLMTYSLFFILLFTDLLGHDWWPKKGL